MTLALISHPDCLSHVMGSEHPERPERLQVIQHELMNSDISSELKSYLAPLATYNQLARVHDKNYIDSIFQRAPKMGLISLDPDTFMNPFTLPAALRAAGANILAVDLVMSGKEKVAFCNVRPPGHHAEHAKAMGFCIFNNLAVGVAHALEHYQLKRVAIVDFDVHHGNGTEDIFQNEKRVLFCSSFQYPFYPFSGADTKSDHIINIPLPAGTNSRNFRSEIEQNWFDSIRNFNPEIIFFSAGFDGHYLDPLANMELTESDYAWLTHQIRQIAEDCCQGRMVSTLEGGYALDILGRCALAHVEALIK
jgi:acetoin utilization deacetylase AcuC-like enzyme